MKVSTGRWASAAGLVRGIEKDDVKGNRSAFWPVRPVDGAGPWLAWRRCEVTVEARAHEARTD